VGSHQPLGEPLVVPPMRELTITTLTHTGEDGYCVDSRTCPAVRTIAEHPGKYFVVLTLAAFAPVMGAGEILGTAPRSVIDRAGQAGR
jgi:hypothetical protein